MVSIQPQARAGLVRVEHTPHCESIVWLGRMMVHSAARPSDAEAFAERLRAELGQAPEVAIEGESKLLRFQALVNAVTMLRRGALLAKGDSDVAEFICAAAYLEEAFFEPLAPFADVATAKMKEGV